MTIMKVVPAAAFAIACSATTLFAQPPAPPVTQPATPPMTQPPPPPVTQPTTPPVTQPTTQTQTPVAAPAITTPSAQSPATDTDHGTAIVLLDRIQNVLDAAVDDKKGKDGSVAIDRGLVDEIRAEVTQVKMTLQGEKNQGAKK